MRSRITSLLPWVLGAAGLISLVTSEVLKIVFRLNLGEDALLFLPTFVGATAMCVVGAWVASRTKNRLGWVLIAIPLTTGIALLGDPLSTQGARTGAWYAATAFWIRTWPFLASLILLIAIFYLYPTGRIPSRRWRWPWRIYLISGVVCVAGFAVLPTDERIAGRDVSNPLGIEAISSPLGVALGIAGFLLVLSAFASFASLWARYRSVGPEERQQLRWLFLVGEIGAVLLVSLLLMVAILGDPDTGAAARADDIVMLLLVTDIVVGIPVAVGIAILKYRLYDIDIVINKTVVFGALAVFITAVYVGIVVGVGALAGRGGEPNVALSIAATAVVAILFQPVRERVERFANRLVYGKRATPYEVMAGFSRRMAGTLSVDEVLPQMAEASAQGVGAVASRVRVFLPDGEQRIATWPEGDTHDSSDRTLTVRYGDEPVGEIEVTKPRGEPLTPSEDRLLADLAAQAGLAFHNVRLADELQARLEKISEQSKEIQVSRRRIVRARDEALRRLEADLEGGAQQQLMMLSKKLLTATDTVTSDPQRSAVLLEEVGTDANDALETLRDLARGIFPPLLAEEGLIAALDAHINKHALPATLEGEGIRRYDPSVEAAVYFCCIEAMQNASKFAPGSSITIKMQTSSDGLDFSITDDGPGFDPEPVRGRPGITNMSDRVEAVGGSLEIRSAMDRGTLVAGRIPARELKTAS
ncbi:MAG: ATP-binding protein [Actinomycetota bacterium]